MSTIFLVSRNFFLKSLIKLLHFETYSDSEAIFGIYRVDLVNKILISAHSNDLWKSASSTARPKLWPRCGGMRWGWSKNFFDKRWSLWVHPVEILLILFSYEVCDNFPTLVYSILSSSRKWLLLFRSHIGIKFVRFLSFMTSLFVERKCKAQFSKSTNARIYKDQTSKTGEERKKNLIVVI